MAFQYEAFNPAPYALSIGDLLAHMGDPQAHAAEVIAQAQAHAAEVRGQAYGQAAQGIGNAVSGAIQQANDPREQLARQQVAANQRDLSYQTTATNVAKSLVGPNGEQPDPDVAGAVMTKAGVPITAQKPIIDSLTSMAGHHKEALADAGHIAYQVISTLPSEATADDKAHAASAALGAAVATGVVSGDQAQQVTKALANGSDPMGMALGLMGASPSKRYDDLLKPLVTRGAGSAVVQPGRPPVIPVPDKPQLPTEPSLLADAATLGTPQETPTAANSKRAVDLAAANKNPPSLDQQLLDAVKKGDAAGAATITQTMKAAAAAKGDPAAIAAANRQAATINAQIAQQGRAQTFTEQQAGRTELTNKVEAPYLDAREKADTLRNVVDLAKNGNKEAANVQALLGVLGLVTSEGVKRINTTELDQVQGAGSLFDKIKSKAGSWTAGQPLPDGLQNDLVQLSNMLEQSARKKYEQGFQQVTSRYKLTDETPIAPSASGPAAPGVTLTPGLKGLGDRK